MYLIDNHLQDVEQPSIFNLRLEGYFGKWINFKCCMSVL